MEDEFHETQRARDCSVHSLNNALGRQAITAAEVVAEIDRRVSAYAEELQKLGAENVANRVNAYRRSLSDGKTYFTAESVWIAALSLGRITAMPVAVKTLDPAAATIVLGKTKEGTYHAIAVRDGKIRDSLKEDVVDFSITSLLAIIEEVYGFYELK